MPPIRWWNLFRPLLATLPVAAALACSAAGGGESMEEFDPSSGTASPIRNPTGKATAYPEAALVNMGGGRCSGAVVAPRVALTAGHCITGTSTWTVTTPYAKDPNGQPQKRTATGAWTEYKSWGGSVNPNTPDVGLIFFDKGEPFKLAVWPRIQDVKVASGTKAINVGRVQNGSLSSTDLFMGAPITLSQSSGFPYSYGSVEIIQSGDSGGPVFLTGGQPHMIVAVNSGAGGGQILARTDTVIDKIVQLIAQHGGPGVDDEAGGGGSGTGGAAGAGGAPGGGGACDVQEVEPNDPFSKAQSFVAGTVCGAFQQVGDEDWYKWSVPGAGVTYHVSVSGSDAQVAMWKFVGGQYHKIAGQPSTITNTSNGSGEYVISVWSPTGSVGDYQLVLSRSDVSGGGSGGSGGSAGSGGSGGGGGSPGGSCNGDLEQEPNNATNSAQTIHQAICGQTDNSDWDWYTWTAASAGVFYDVRVEGQGLKLSMFKSVNGQLHHIANTSPTQITNTSNGPGSYYIAVSTSYGVQPYRLILDGPNGFGGSGGSAGSGGIGGSGGAGGSGGDAGSGGSAGDAGSGGSGGSAGTGGTGGAPPSADVQWMSFPVQKSASNSAWGTLLTDIERHLPSQYGSQYSDSDTVTHAHETTHGINSHLRNYFNNTGKKANGFYLTNDLGVIIVEPAISKAVVAPYVPTSLREFRFATYITGQTAWNDTPLYIIDEWVAYANGTAVGVNRVKEGKWNSGWRDQLGNIEFLVYSMSLGMAVRDKDPTYFNDYVQFRAFLKWHGERSMALYHEAQGMPEFAWDRCETFYSKIRTAPDAEDWRQFVRQTFGDDWAQSVIGI